MLCTLLEPTSGTATIDGLDTVRQANAVRKIVNMIAGGERMVYGRLTGRENLAYFADLYDVDRRVKRKRVDELLDVVGLTQRGDQRVEQYSKGMKQRLQIARGLINDPRYLFLDEPTLGLDAPIAREIRRMIKRLNKTILFTTHYLEEAEELCDEILILQKGEVIEQGTNQQLKRKYRKSSSLIVRVECQDERIDQILESLRHAYQASISTQPVERGYEISISTDSTRDIASELAGTLTATGCRLLELRSVEPSLEDILVTISGDGSDL
jgi:ABC-2 type transport system ATP-binding protein